MDTLMRDELEAGLHLQKAAKVALASLIQQSNALDRHLDDAQTSADLLSTLRQEGVSYLLCLLFVSLEALKLFLSVELLRQERNELQAQLAGAGPMTLRSKIVQELAELKEPSQSLATASIEVFGFWVL
jgi:hypothetical protein